MPQDVKLRNGRARFTITVTYDTLELYGKVVGTRDVIVESKPASAPAAP